MYFIEPDDRLEGFIVELDTVPWDVGMVTGTWKAEKEEVMQLLAGHILMASRGALGKRRMVAVVCQRLSANISGFNVHSASFMT